MVTYFLRPFNSSQSQMPNWRNVAYRRTGTYKGIGDDLSDRIAQLPTDPLPPVLYTTPYALTDFQTPPPPRPTTNYTPWLIAGGIVLVALLARRR